MQTRGERQEIDVPTSAPAPLLDLELRPGGPPLLSVVAAGDPGSWAARHRDALRAAVTEHGALLVRGLGMRDAAVSASVFRRLADLVTEREAYAARRLYSDRVYSATKWPPRQPMCVHHELSYRLEVPGLMLFSCLAAPTDGGATLLADSSAVLSRLPDDLVERFDRLGWILVRNYDEDIGASVGESFGTEDRAEVERYCRANAIELEWLADGALRTRQRRSAIVRHPRTGRRCWFNQIAFLSAWTLDPEVREYLVDLHGEEGLPFDTRFGDGDPIGAEDVRAIHAAYEAGTVRVPWRAGDLLFVDNIRTAHGREAFEGPRELVVAMADAVDRRQA
jgi:alpha-ketoglutarate-dependent taurine dioxygenase